MTDATYLPGHQLQLLQGGHDYFRALLAAVDASHTEVRLETYIYAFDVEGERVAQALECAALRGVRVALLMDGIGTPQVPPQWQQRWDAAGVHWLRFAPLGRLGLLVPSHWRRLHRKLAVVDGAVAFCGGINILDDYSDPQHGPQQVARFDFAVQAQGPLVAQVHTAMAQLWDRLLATRQLEQGQWSAARAVWLTMARPQAREAVPVSQGGALAALVLRDNVRNRKRIERAYRKALGTAQREVLIANAYFLPGGKLLRALVHAAQRGVRVRLLLQGRYEYFMQYHAARPVFGLLMAAGVEIHEYTSGFLHAKVAVVDQQWATVGSSNLDPLSLLLAREANVVVQDAAFAAALQQRLEAAMAQHGRALDALDFGRRPLGQRALDWLAYGLMRLTLLLAGRRY
ncbi:MAG: cardiolipin synthase B [Curvibacter sp. RIFCSPHIGHO2_12_FULL_63_18]|uniref:cardiolipin synthase ClsB n=1 Tax=Rhodoferax sp. TaxID=50421 RepID=UPI0008CDD47F|nr:cardiolipin synthase ClsB [Rhodoferax sp.]OGO93911.1 MAG: cardiolipin synthase B [Curvibacter sp. GWA2_63_95]OGP02210.1 MAG: cardiolipin synthase B [Curvibacter sp. RIFCSPHIGHO2_12_FULL_63_18]HCX81741.1 cardiolipin synthase ClsB [Rhodoferax sp.]